MTNEELHQEVERLKKARTIDAEYTIRMQERMRDTLSRYIEDCGNHSRTINEKEKSIQSLKDYNESLRSIIIALVFAFALYTLLTIVYITTK